MPTLFEQDVAGLPPAIQNEILNGDGVEISTAPLYGKGTIVVAMNESVNNNLNDLPVDLGERSEVDETIDYNELIKENAFVGEYPFEVIKEGIINQFNDYINTEDRTNYVEIFYESMQLSYSLIDDEEEHPSEIKEVLSNIEDQFNSLMEELFSKRLTLTFNDIKEDDENTREYSTRLLYQFFIIDAKKNFKHVITKVVGEHLSRLGIKDDREFYKEAKESLTSFSPLVTAVGPMEFIRYCKNEDVFNLFNDNIINGNFLRKYSPNFAVNEEFEVEVISNITMVQEVKEELIYGKQ